jgi:hypothetical protein
MRHEVRSDLSYQEVSALLRYDADSGMLFWKQNCSRGLAGAVAGCVNSHGYRRIQIHQHFYPAHRLAWLLTHGEWPTGPLDHINGIRSDNRIANLREASPSENQHNRRMSKNNSSGHPGVTFDRGKYVAAIGVRGKKVYLGRFLRAEEAGRAYREAKKKLHPSSPKVLANKAA